MCSMVDPCILAILAFRLIEDFIGAIQEGPAYVCMFAGTSNT